ncbi:MAG: hypothetical protein C9355_04815 [Thalassolituus maritimus]|uniref:Membrane protein involved in the export of O-antigen and teichoic acid n=1 Tax=Thalassolituus maritimus TaxID=484498 RepID=A0A1N7N472_9GAMM|nr:hypothetical protein [Thalassolituus maritimus]TPD55170.1 MAG: hypothetical protein C9355_04815 [Thalassolituus maritimus]SIS92959.1 hypothetical protein SAMN05421686_106163 [Thalassolituus maritimus]
MSLNFNRIDRDLLIVATGKIIQIMVAFVALRLLTYQLDVSEVGRYYILLSLLTFVNFLFLNGVGQYYNRFLYNYKDAGSLASATKALFLARTILILVATTVMLPFFFLSEISKNFSFYYFFPVILLSLFAGTALAFINAVNILKFRVAFVGYTVVYSVAGVALAFTFTEATELGAIGWLIGISIGQLSVLYFSYNKLIIMTESGVSLKGFLMGVDFKGLIAFVIPISLVLLLQWVNNSSFRLLIAESYSLEVVAGVSVAFAVSASIFNAFEGFLTQYYLPGYYSSISAADREVRLLHTNSIISKLLGYYFLLFGFIVFFSDYILILLVDSKFHHLGLYLKIAAGFELFRASSNVIYLVSQSEVNTKGAIFPYAAGAAALVFSLSIFNFQSEMFFVPLIVFLSSLLVFILLFLSMRKLLPIVFPWKSLMRSLILVMPLSVTLLLEIRYELLWVIFLSLAGSVYFLFSLLILYREDSSG